MIRTGVATARPSLHERRGLTAAPRRRRSVKLPDTVAVLLALVLIFTELMALGANTALLSAAGACAEIVVAIAVILLVRPSERLWQGMAPILLPIALALLWSALPTLLDGRISLPMAQRPAADAFPLEFSKLLGVFAFLVTGAALGHRPGVTRRFFDLFVLFGFAYVVTTLLMRQNDPFTVFGIDKGPQRIRFTGSLLSANAAACVFAIIAILSFGRCQLAWRQTSSAGWARGPGWFAGFCGIAALLALGACALTRSRASLALAVVAIVLMALRQWRRPVFGGGIAIRYGAPAAVAAGLGLLALTAGPTLDRFGSLSSDAGDRIYGIRHFLALADVSPWFGYGLGSFSALNIATLGPANVDILWNLGAAHDAPIQAALEAGWPFMILIFLAIAIAVVRAIRARRVETPDPLMLAQLMAVALTFACALADIALNVPALCAMTALLSGMVLGRVERAMALVHPPRRRADG